MDPAANEHGLSEKASPAAVDHHDGHGAHHVHHASITELQQEHGCSTTGSKQSSMAGSRAFGYSVSGHMTTHSIMSNASASEHSFLTVAAAADAIHDEVSQSVLQGVPSAAVSRIPTGGLSDCGEDEEGHTPHLGEHHTPGHTPHQEEHHTPGHTSHQEQHHTPENAGGDAAAAEDHEHQQENEAHGEHTSEHKGHAEQQGHSTEHEADVEHADSGHTQNHDE